MLSRFHDDTARLRRALVDFGLMARQGDDYWRVDTPDGAERPHRSRS